MAAPVGAHEGRWLEEMFKRVRRGRAHGGVYDDSGDPSQESYDDGFGRLHVTYFPKNRLPKKLSYTPHDCAQHVGEVTEVTYYPDGAVESEKYQCFEFPDGKDESSYIPSVDDLPTALVYRKGGPAQIFYSLKGVVVKQEYLEKPNVIHRIDGPAATEYYDDGAIRTVAYMEEEVPHRADGPAIVLFRPDGTVETEEYRWEGDLERAGGGPAEVWYHQNGAVAQENYFEKNIPHRVDGPASIRYREDGSVKQEEYYDWGQHHREDGAADIVYDARGEVGTMDYWLHGEECTRYDLPGLPMIQPIPDDLSPVSF
jgi:antitoxin component YwqK of YwqJK toxin-antitoxin module